MSYDLEEARRAQADHTGPNGRLIHPAQRDCERVEAILTDAFDEITRLRAVVVAKDGVIRELRQAVTGQATRDGYADALAALRSVATRYDQGGEPVCWCSGFTVSDCTDEPGCIQARRAVTGDRV